MSEKKHYHNELGAFDCSVCKERRDNAIAKVGRGIDIIMERSRRKQIRLVF